MRSFTIGRIAVATLIATTAALGCATARAGELFVMPYACRVVGSEPVLTPSADQGYAIIGQREQRDFTACSPVNPDMCRRWTVYRFDVDCAGKRVPWTSLSAAADAQRGGRSWVENGRMQLEMPPRWNIAPDDPCARRSRYAWRSGPLSRYCADRRAMAPPPVVEMPAGFAPMLELDGIFVADERPGIRTWPCSRARGCGAMESRKRRASRHQCRLAQPTYRSRRRPPHHRPPRASLSRRRRIPPSPKARRRVRLRRRLPPEPARRSLRQS